MIDQTDINVWKNIRKLAVNMLIKQKKKHNICNVFIIFHCKIYLFIVVIFHLFVMYILYKADLEKVFMFLVNLLILK